MPANEHAPSARSPASAPEPPARFERRLGPRSWRQPFTLIRHAKAFLGRQRIACAMFLLGMSISALALSFPMNRVTHETNAAATMIGSLLAIPVGWWLAARTRFPRAMMLHGSPADSARVRPKIESGDRYRIPEEPTAWAWVWVCVLSLGSGLLTAFLPTFIVSVRAARRAFESSFLWTPASRAVVDGVGAWLVSLPVMGTWGAIVLILIGASARRTQAHAGLWACAGSIIVVLALGATERSDPFRAICMMLSAVPILALAMLAMLFVHDPRRAHEPLS